MVLLLLIDQVFHRVLFLELPPLPTRFAFLINLIAWISSSIFGFAPLFFPS